jgi:hypothetical protein
MSRGWVVRLLACAVVLAGAGCGRGHPAAKPSTTTSTAPTTSTVPTPAVSVRPATGPVGTTFTLTATHFRPGETLRFQIQMPNGKIFKGPFHQVPANGTVEAPYKTTSPDDPPGGYNVKAATDKGVSAVGGFTLTPTTPPSAGSPSSSTTRPGATTSR